MTTFINLDLSMKTKVTDYGFQINESPLPTIYFLLYDEHYVVDYSKLNNLSLMTEMEMSKRRESFTFRQAEFVDIDGLTYIKWNIPARLLQTMDTLKLTPIFNYDSKTIILNEFKLIIFKTMESETSMIKVAIQNFNKMYRNYLLSVKRTEIGKPLGVVPLDSNGRINLSYINDDITKHIGDTIYDTLYTINDIHGLRINRKNYSWEYYHNTDDEWYTVNSIHGGRFGFPNNESPTYDVFGGLFTDVSADTLDGGKFGVRLVSAVDSGKFGVPQTNAYDAGLFNSVKPPATGGGFNDKADPVTGGGFII